MALVVERRTELRERHRGPVIAPGDDRYDGARATFNGIVDRRPEVVVRPLDAADVVTAVRFAREGDLPVSIRGGGHGVAGHCVGDGSVAVDLRLMRQVVVDPEKRTATCGGGALWDDLDPPCQVHGLATPGGTFGDTGVAGLTLGGGLGHLSPSLGLTLDNLLAATVVTADGTVVSASEAENPELFWALRGGGGNFGVVTQFTFQLHPVGLLLGGQIDFRYEDAPVALTRWRDVMANAPDHLASFGQVYRNPLAGQAGANMSFAWLGAPDEGNAVIAELTEGLTPTRNTVRPMHYCELQDIYERIPFGLRNYWSGRFLGELPDELLMQTIEIFRDPAMAGGVLIEPMHGAPARHRVRCHGVRRTRSALERDVHQRLDRSGRGRARDRESPCILALARTVAHRRRLSQLRDRGGVGQPRDGVRCGTISAVACREAGARPRERLQVQPQHRDRLIPSRGRLAPPSRS